MKRKSTLAVQPAVIVTRIGDELPKVSGDMGVVPEYSGDWNDRSLVVSAYGPTLEPAV